MFRSSFDKNLENATSHLRLEPDWPSILLICDEINQKDVTPKNAFAAIKKKMNSPNPHSSCYSLLVLESIVKNCGAPVHEEVFTKENCEMFSSFLESTPHENVRQKMLELVQTWANAFRSSDKYQAIKDTMTILKAKGHTFPELREADAMFTADTAPNWADGRVCHRCRVEFTFTNRKHHCRNCGQVFCGQCTAKQCPLPKYGIEKEVRVCDGCFAALQRPTSGGGGGKSASRPADSELPAEYLNSTLAQQVQTPARKTEAELKEEEELQLALALSQSEAEQQKPKQQAQPAAAYRMQQRSPSPEAPPPEPKEYHQQQQPEEANNPELAKYLNRSYWEQRKISESSSMASPSAPSPMPPTPQPQQIMPLQTKSADELQIDEFAANMRTQVEIFVNRMKSNSSRGRSISNDSSVQTLFMTLTSLHSQQLSYIKEMDDKRMWYEQLQDKLTQIKDSRAALDQLRQEHVEKLRRIAEEQERQRQMQMAQKLDIMRKKKQEYLQYQRQLALQRIQEQEREMQLRQEQQKAQYLMGQAAPPFPYMPPSAVPQHGSPSHQLNNVYNPYAAGYLPQAPAPAPNGHGQFQAIPPGMYNPSMQQPMPPNLQQPGGLMQQPAPPGNAQMMPPMPENQFANNPAILQQPQAPQAQQLSNPQMPFQQQPPQQIPGQQPQQIPGQQPQQIPGQQPQQIHMMLQQQPPAPQAAPPVTEITNNQVQAVAAAPAPPQNEPKAEEPATAELISFD
ncbi:hepatocyte growth factor-regulated tyrosine kinase substrate isoform X1 [Drosophila takahashii]|uniref:hepatocyte growth factor-regulated tyrosine kinase substrate isoform X1 n=1 Tax=Drosophila takahashii TaxID=29030 RepID=UPI003898E9AD